MAILTRNTLFAAALFGIAQMSSAIPTAAPRSSNNIIRGLSKRNAVVFEDCGDENSLKRQTAGLAWNEASILASFTNTGTYGKDNTKFQGTKAYQNHFIDSDFDTVQKMTNAIYDGSSDDGGNALQLKFTISCKETDACADNALAATDAAPLTDDFTPTIRLCPQFFKDARTANNLTSRSYDAPGRRKNTWCQPGQPFKFFETAAHTFLHEMTHLDQLGVAAGLSERDIANSDIKTHGTDDIYDIATGYDKGNPNRAARQLKINWDTYNNDNSKKKPDIQRVENAESYAAAATEFWFQSKCNWDSILE